ncbi:Alpha-ketoglutarate-dependent dioxygenase AlkB [Roseovarius gaetbuli]|uniref:Alpha-ketoglutarate-dependent dioxygenase AlkB n=1 Tax=Roseovarius gaetbuli TaxID=1356575 RepID=A0A1X7A5H5_9RHOB|nr:alpha-ketoglutarate-dependent dioxygenase AlkB [Roseovarius gaetbuli]SLN69152.1 Alpha-ketoglutarate-dependent dioxygenase AlkB [Roseovarius gaetbuli]
MAEPTLNVRGCEIYEGWLDGDAQAALVQDLRDVVAQAPLFTPRTPRGKPMSVRMTSAGKYGWYSDRRGYRYEGAHPKGGPWPTIPPAVLDIWRALVSPARMPDCCLINYYTSDARMGLHQDRDEADFAWPVLSVSLGDDALFRIGSDTKGGATSSVWLNSGDVVVMGGAARLCYHGIDRIRPGTSALFQGTGRINLTCRVVD